MTHEEENPKFELTYELHADDSLAFSKHTYQTSRATRLMRTGGYVLVALVYLVGYAFELWARRFWQWEYLAPVLAKQVLELAFYMSVYYLLLRWLFKFMAVRMTKEGRNAGILCKHRVVVDGEAFFDGTDVGDQRVLWRGVERVEQTDAHIFVYIGSATAFVVPKWAFATEREAQEFFQAARTYQMRAA
jgi:hypothetical protein